MDISAANVRAMQLDIMATLYQIGRDQDEAHLQIDVKAHERRMQLQETCNVTLGHVLNAYQRCVICGAASLPPIKSD